ncbi:MAG: hypothetical protein A2Z94_08030 [Gallionellales bacterium GWA2_55_18]|nr:MAG: hypothetical protein A2Z94_08030 [Gallionellales bacterium GWA2_55_18]
MNTKLTFPMLVFCNCALAFDAPQYDRAEGGTDDMRIIGIECHKKLKVLEIGYFTTYNLPTKTMDLWDTFYLKKNKEDSDYVESVHELVRRCNIGKDRYIVKIRPVPGNWNLNGRCGGATYGGAKIIKNGVLIFDANFEECESKEIISKVRISTGSKHPAVTKMTRKNYYGYE